MEETTEGENIPVQEARQGRRVGLIRVLGIGTGVAIIGMILILLLQAET